MCERVETGVTGRILWTAVTPARQPEREEFAPASHPERLGDVVRKVVQRLTISEADIPFTKS